MSNISRKEKAIALFKEGYNCSQAVVLAFSDLIDIDEKQLKKLAGSFGGGMGRLREVCGAVSGMFMVAGLLYGYDDPCDSEAKKEHYALIQRLAKVFEEKTGSIICRTLKGLDKGPDDPAPEPRSEAYYNKYPCAELVGLAAEIMDREIQSRN